MSYMNIFVLIFLLNIQHEQLRASEHLKVSSSEQQAKDKLHKMDSSNCIVVVFACNSNSCRSQMAEGWAKEWLRLEKIKCTNSNFQLRRNLLKRIFIDSVALDKSRVFNDPNEQLCLSCSHADPLNKVSEEDLNTTCNLESHVRKKIKKKALLTLANQGVDISHQEPSTCHEVLDRVSSWKKSVLNQEVQDDNLINQLVIMCDCGYEAKQQLIELSSSVIEIKVDPPTTMAKNGEGDHAYDRVSLEIKNHVFSLMKELTQNTQFKSK